MSSSDLKLLVVEKYWCDRIFSTLPLHRYGARIRLRMFDTEKVQVRKAEFILAVQGIITDGIITETRLITETHACELC